MTDHPKKIEELFREIRAAGMRVNNLFHRMDGMWQCNLRSRDNNLFFEYGYGPSPQDAIEKALASVAKNNRVRKPMPDDDNRDPMKVGSTKEPTNHVDPHPEALPDDDDDFLGGTSASAPAAAAAADDDDYDLG